MTKRKNDFLDSMDYIDGITIVDTSGTILFSVKFNPSFHPEIVDGESVIGRTLYDIFTNINRENSTLIKTMEMGIPIYKKKQAITDITGSEINTMNISLPIKTNGRILGAIELSKDITKYKFETESVLEMNEEVFRDHHMMEEKLGPNAARYTVDDIISNNNKMSEIKYFVKKISESPAPVFIYGETGTGKELFAHAIHNSSSRSGQPFIAQNCAAIPENLLESILFGTTKGSFTGAYDSPGLFELADGGTLFLDEINSMPPTLQAKLLRVLQDSYVRRLGDRKERKIDVRIITASNISPKKCLMEGYLRQDIYYRLCVLALHVPPLRERMDDVDILLNYFIGKYNSDLKKNIKNVSKEVYSFLKNYNWPGNVRELQHIIEYAMNIVDSSEDTIEIEHIESRIYDLSPELSKNDDIEIRPMKVVISEIEKNLISKALNKTSGNVSEAARILEIPRQTLQRKRKLYNIY